MSLDVNSLFLITIDIEAMLGLLLLYAWVQNPGLRAVAWWGWAYLLRATSVGLFGLYGSIPDAISIDFADALLFLAYAATWTGARVFDGRRPLPIAIATGAVLWVLLAHMPRVSGAPDLRFLLASGTITAYIWLAAYEFWRGRGEPLLSRWPAIFILFGHGSLFLLHTPLPAVLPWTPISKVFDSVWPTVLSLEALLFTIAIAFILLAMAKERAEYRHRTAAMLDPLTGIANRRSFLDEAAKLTRHAETAVLAIDLDQFKSINDRFGHAVGDRVLQLFAEIARAAVAASGLVGRLGGEEFAAVLCNAKVDEAIGLAEQMRRAFAEAASHVDGHWVRATASIGIVLNRDVTLGLYDLLVQADQALYRAKTRGRNCIELANAMPLTARTDPPAPPFVPSEHAA